MGHLTLLGRGRVPALLAVLAFAGCTQDAAIKSSGAAMSDAEAPAVPPPTASASAEPTARPNALAGWVKYVSPKCGYEIMMPAEPKDVTPAPRPGSRVSYDMMRGGSDPTVVEVLCGDLTGPPADVAATRTAVIQSSLDRGGWEKTAQRETKLGAHDVTEATGVQPNHHILIVTLFVGARSYTALLATSLDPSILEEVKATFKVPAH